MSLDPNYSACWLQLIVFLFSKEHIFLSPLNVILDTRNFMLRIFSTNILHCYFGM